MPSPRRVLMTADTVGGVFQYALELGASLARQGDEVTLATMGRPLSPGQRAAVSAVRPEIDVEHGDFKLEWMDDPWADVDRSGAWLLDLARRVGADIVHVNGYAHAALPFDCPVVAVAHSCVLSWWQAVRRSVPPDSLAEYRRRVSEGVALADAVVAPSGAMMDALLDHYPPPRARAVIYNGRDPVEFAPSEKHPFILALGRVWDEGKNLAELELVAGEVPWPIIVGGPSALDEERGSPFRKAQYFGFLEGPAVRTLMSRASIYAFPARYEPFGLSVLEAGLSGAALVLGDIASLREIWGDAAFFVDPDDASCLAEVLRRLIADKHLLREMGQRARDRAIRYTSSAMLAGYSTLYEEVLAASRRARREAMGATCA